MKNFDNEFLNQFKPKEKELTLDNLKEEVKKCLLLKKRREATEIVTAYIKHNNKIYTIRDDDNPEIWIYVNGIYLPHGKTYIEETCRMFLEEIFTTQFSNEVIGKIRSDTYIDSDYFFQNNELDEIAVLNGILNLKTGSLIPFTPEKIFFNKINAEWVEGAECPAIKQHLRNILKSEDDVKVIQELIGFCLYKNYFIEKAFMFTGTGRNGKGKTITLIEDFLGKDNVSNIELQELEENPFALSNVMNKLANVGGDIDKRALIRTNKFKGLVGRDKFFADRKFKTRINFRSFAKLIFSANELPLTYDLTPAFWDRWILLDFPYKFIHKKEYDQLIDKAHYKIMDSHIIDKLTTRPELNGLLQWAFEGLQRLFKIRDFSYSKTAEDVKTVWLRKSNSFLAFFMDELEEDFNSKISKEDLRRIFSLYNRKHKVSNASDKMIHNIMSEKGVSDSKLTKAGNVFNCWLGVKFKRGFIDIENWSNYNGDLLDDQNKEETLRDFNSVINQKVKEEDVEDE